MRNIVARLAPLIFSASTALAQAGPPAEGAPAAGTTDSGVLWWIAILAILAVVAFWYVAKSRNRPKGKAY